MHYIEMNGLGNKFVIIDKDQINPQLCLKDLAVSLSNSPDVNDFDQMILYQACEEYVEMFVYNNDGSSAGMCGNASRCLMKLMHDEKGIKSMKLKIGERILDCSYSSDEEIYVNMGQANFNPEWSISGADISERFIKSKIDTNFIAVADVGNPHIIILLKVGYPRELLEEIGIELQKDKYFPDGINVNFALIKDGEIHLTVYERGAGFTDACGSGGTATFACLFEGKFVKESSIVHFPGGDLSMLKSESGLVMSGNAQKTGEADFHHHLSFAELAV